MIVLRSDEAVSVTRDQWAWLVTSSVARVCHNMRLIRTTSTRGHRHAKISGADMSSGVARGGGNSGPLPAAIREVPCTMWLTHLKFFGSHAPCPLYGTPMTKS